MIDNSTKLNISTDAPLAGMQCYRLPFVNRIINNLKINKMSKYTESKITRMGSHRWGFWKVGERKTNGVEGFEIHWSDDGECITDHVYTEEDANLIAASPLMLETLKHLQAVGGLGLKNHEYIKKAIDVAEGRL